MHVLIADKFEQSGRDGLQAIGCEVSFQPDLKDESLVEEIGTQKPDVLIVRGTKVTEQMLAAGPLKLIVRAGAGYNTIDVAAASRRGIYVSNCPGKNSIAVAELAFALILALDRRIADNIIALRAGEWNKKEFSKARGLFGRTLGLLGLGKIGQEMIPRAKAFGMPVIAWSRSLTEEKAAELGVARMDSTLDVAREADIVSVHVALKPDTRMLVGPDFFKRMKERAYFINTSRGEVVDPHQPRIVWLCVIAIDPGCWHRCWTRSRPNISTSRRWRTSSSKALKPPWRESIWTRRHHPQCWIACARGTPTLSN